MRALVSFISAAIFASLSATALANGPIHSTNSEMGYTTHPDHANSGKSRAEALAEIEQARKDGTWQYHRIGAPLPMKAGTPLTREQVEADLLRTQQHPTWNARRVGAPVTME